MSEQPKQQPEIDDTQDRMGSVRELDFQDPPAGRIGDERPRGEVEDEFPPQRAAEIGMTGGETLSSTEHEDNVSLDDLTPETLIDDGGSESQFDPADETPIDTELRVVGEEEIGGGIGLDEAELGRSAPLDGKPWTDQVTPPETSSDDETE